MVQRFCKIEIIKDRELAMLKTVPMLIEACFKGILVNCSRSSSEEVSPGGSGFSFLLEFVFVPFGVRSVQFNVCCFNIVLSLNAF